MGLRELCVPPPSGFLGLGVGVTWDSWRHRVSPRSSRSASFATWLGIETSTAVAPRRRADTAPLSTLPWAAPAGGLGSRGDARNGALSVSEARPACTAHSALRGGEDTPWGSRSQARHILGDCGARSPVPGGEACAPPLLPALASAALGSFLSRRTAHRVTRTRGTCPPGLSAPPARVASSCPSEN